MQRTRHIQARSAVPAGIALSIALLVTGCTQSRPAAPLTGHMAGLSRHETAAVAERICSVSGLEEQHRVMQRQFAEISRDPHWHTFLTGQASTNQRTDAVYRRVPLEQDADPAEASERIRLSRIVDLDIDASYRLAVSACQAYMFCAQTPGGARGYGTAGFNSCSDELENWTDAQNRYSHISLRLAEIRTELARIGTTVPAPPPSPSPPSRPAPACRDHISGIFTSSSCSRP
jgi:hypothetical protein